MSLEKELAANTAALEENTAATKALAELLAGGAMPKNVEAENVNKNESSETKNTEEGGEGDTNEENDLENTEVTKKDLQDGLKALVQACGGDKSAAKKLLSKFKVAKIPDLPEDDYVDCMAAINKQLKALEK